MNGQYCLRDLLGCGGFGAVFLAEKLVNNQAIAKVAVKLVSWEDDKQEQQTKELELATTLKHDKLINLVHLSSVCYRQKANRSNRFHTKIFALSNLFIEF